MAESLQYSRVRGETQSVFLNTGKLLGIDSISIQNNFGANTLNYLGVGNKQNFQIPISEQSSDVSLNGSLINSDSFIQHTGAQPINLFILKDKNNTNSALNNYCLISGYLNSYSARFEINSIPQISTSFKFYKDSGPLVPGNLDPLSSGQLTNISSNNYDIIPSGLEIPYGDSLNLTLDEYTTNRVQEFNINYNINRTPIYNVGSRFMKRVDIIYPIEVNCSFSFEVGYLSGAKLTDFPQNKKTQNISLTVNGQTGAAITSYNLTNMTMINESLSQSIDSNLLINRSYIGYIKE